MTDEMDLATQDVFLRLPVEGDAPNFRLLRQADGRGAVQLVAECYRPDGMSVEPIPLNQPVEFGAARIAVRDSSQEWSDEVLRGGVYRPAPRKSWGARAVAASIVTVLVLALAVGAAVWSTPPAWHQSTEENVLAWLAGVPCQVIARDGRVYVIANDVAAFSWVRRLLAERDATGDVELRLRAEETEKVERRLEQDGIAFFKVDLSDARRPVILLRAISRTPSQESLPDVARRVIDTLPYATTVVPAYRFAQEARAAALDVAAQLGVPVESREAGDRFVVAIGGGLDDAQLQVLSQGLKRLESTWGQRYVRFVVKQRDISDMNGMKSGVDGYRILAGRHIVFSEFGF